ncbi:MAG: MarR family winged helix-turn-helix transcriptional regulator [Actinomycetota bacterium]
MQRFQDEPLTRLVVMTGKAIREYFEDQLADAGASLVTWVVLNEIDHGTWDSQRGLAKQLRIEGATLTRHLDRMEREGLIVRTRDDDDRRQIRVDMTTEGRTLHRRLRTKANAVGSRATAGITGRDEATLRRVLARLRDNLGGVDADER